VISEKNKYLEMTMDSLLSNQLVTKSRSVGERVEPRCY